MKTRRLGASDLQVSVVGLGCNNFGMVLDREGAAQVVDGALEAGVSFFDTADVYGNRGGSETMLGDILGQRRCDVVLATKFGAPMWGPEPASPVRGHATRAYVAKAVEASLRRLRTDWIDLYQLHWPDSQTPIGETLEALAALVRQGKVRYIGCSNLSGAELEAAAVTAAELGLPAFVSTQQEYSLLHRAPEESLVPLLQRRGLGLIPYFPLASGLLSGKYREGLDAPEGSRLAKLKALGQQLLTPANLETVEALSAFAASRGRTLLELAVSWLAAQRTVASVIAGATRPDQVQANARAADWLLGADDMAEVDRITLPRAANACAGNGRRPPSPIPRRC